MPFLDLYPHKDSPPSEKLDERRGDVLSEYAGSPCLYRLGFQSMVVEGLPEEIRVGRVTIHQTEGPVYTQRTEVSQRPGVRLVFDKTMRTGLEIGTGLPLTVCQIDEEFPATDPSAHISVWRREALAALGLLVAILDERVAQEELFEDVLILRDDRATARGSTDMRRQIRNFLPYPVVPEELPTLARLRDADTISGQATSAARWYLRAVRGGPRPDAIVYFWIAIEALIGTDTTSPKQVVAALEDAGADLSGMSISVGRLAGLRAQVVHQGEEDPARLNEGYYHLEAVCRVLLRTKLGIHGIWPILPDFDAWSPPANEELRRAWEGPPEVHFH